MAWALVIIVYPYRVLRYGSKGIVVGLGVDVKGWLVGIAKWNYLSVSPCCCKV